MKNKINLFVLIFIGLLFAGSIYSAYEFKSFQVGTSATNGDVLQTNGTTSTWVATSTLGITATETYLGTVTSVAMTVPTGLTISGSPITEDGTLALTLTAGYVIPKSASTTEWATAYGWDDHSTAGYVTSAITSLEGQTGATQTFATSSDTNIGITITSSGDVHTFTSQWIGTLDDGRIGSAANWNAKQAGDAALTSLSGLTVGAGGLIVGTGADAFTMLAAGNGGDILTISGGTPYWIATSTINVGTATALADNPTDCAGGEFATAIDASGNLTCDVPTAAYDGDFSWATTYGTLSAATSSALWVQGNLYASSTSIFDGLAIFGNASTTQLSATTLYGALTGNSDTATALSANPADCAIATEFSVGITAAGVATCEAIADADVPDTITVSNYLSLANWFATTSITHLTNATTTQLTVTDLFIGGDNLSEFCGTGLSCTGNTLALNATGNWTGTIDGNNFTGGAIGAGDLLYGSGAGDIAELGIGTNGNILSVVNGLPAWIATSTMPFLSTSYGIGITLSLTNLYATSTIIDDSLAIPQGANPTVNAAGEIAIDTTSGQFKWHDGVKTQIVTGTTTNSFNIASSTLDAFGKNITTGTSTFLLKNDIEPFTMSGYYCKATTTGTVLVRFGDNENWTKEAICTTSGIFTPTATNNTWNAYEDFVVQASSTAGLVQRFTVTVVKQKTAD